MTRWQTWRSRPALTRQIASLTLLALVAAAMLGGCVPKPLQPYSADTPPLALLPATRAGIRDSRARFREIYCAVLEARKGDLPDYRPCEEAMTRVGHEPAGTGMPVTLGQSRRRLIAAVVFGLAADCFEPWLEAPGTVVAHLRAHPSAALCIARRVVWVV